MVKLPTVSIIIPVYNEEKTIEKCLNSCLEQRDHADEIIVVNNNSTDATASIVRSIQRRFPQAHIRLVNEKDQGIIPARDRGFRLSKSDVMGRIDADSVLDPGWVHTVRRTFARKKVAAASGPVVYHDMPLPKVGLAFDKWIRQALYNSAEDHTFLFGSNMAIRKTAWHEVQSMVHRDEADELHEDIDIALSLYRKGLYVAYDPNMIGGMSARRLEDKPRDFYNYVMRFERTFQVHNVSSATARIPIVIYLMIYFPIRTLRKFYDGDTNKFTLAKLRDDLREIAEKI